MMYDNPLPSWDVFDSLSGAESLMVFFSCHAKDVNIGSRRTIVRKIIYKLHIWARDVGRALVGGFKNR